MQYADDRYAVVDRLKIDDMPLDSSPTITRPDRAAVLGLKRALGKVGTCCLDEIGVMKSLGQAPLRHGIVENFVKIATRPGAELAFSHAVQFCAA
jgi:hypothetical protein